MPDKTKHTPGPWRVYEGDDLVVCFGEGDSICDAAPGSPFVSFKTAKANARLIAAAPEMLDALKQILKAAEDGDEITAIALAEAAVAKAEGREETADARP